jgi:NAD(P)-dependent dehydrogenase (short-subunit alcohol dehydrogenase family)
MQLFGKHALVTGGNVGIGRAIVLALAEKGVNVAFNYHKSKAKAEDTIQKLKEYDVKSLMIKADVTDIIQVKGMIEVVK